MEKGILLVITFGCALHFPNLVKTQSHDDVKALLTQLLTTNNYNTMVRPSADQTHPTIMYVNLYLVGITDIDEVREKMSSTAYLELVWVDDYLTWNSSDHNGIEQLYIPQKKVWKPDIALENGYTKMEELGDDFILVTVDYEGHVSWYPFEIFETKCSINIKYFPFDKQTCDIKFGVWTSKQEDIDVELGSKGIILDYYQKNAEWDVVTTSASSANSATDGASVTFSITLQRKPNYILFSVVLPILMLSILAVFTFLLPVDSGEKMSYIMTLYLAFAVFLTIVSAELPVSSIMSLLSEYLVVLLSIGTAIVMITTLQLRIHYRDNSRDIPAFAKFLVRSSRRLQCRNSNRKVRDVNNIDIVKMTDEIGILNTVPSKTVPQRQPTEEIDIKPDEITWPDVTSAIDFYCFWFFLFTNIVATAVIFGNGYVQSQN